MAQSNLTCNVFFSAVEPSADSGRLFLQNGGQRIVTLLVYLNSPRRGGRTSFPQLGLSFTPVKGTALIFFPAFADGRLDTRALHAAEPAVDRKYVSMIWVRQSGERRDAEPSRRMFLGAPAEGGSGSEVESDATDWESDAQPSANSEQGGAEELESAPSI